MITVFSYHKKVKKIISKDKKRKLFTSRHNHKKPDIKNCSYCADIWHFCSFSQEAGTVDFSDYYNYKTGKISLAGWRIMIAYYNKWVDFDPLDS
jgi:hypothetical protein